VARMVHFTGGFVASQELEQAKREVERSLALEPRLPEGFGALGLYFEKRHDLARAADTYAAGLRLAPNNARLLSDLAGVDYGRGQLEQALSTLRRVRELDPRSPYEAGLTSVVLESLRRFPEASAAMDRALSLDPTDPWAYGQKMVVQLDQGDLRGVEATFQAGADRLGLAEMVAHLGRQWVLQGLLPDSAQIALAQLQPSAMDNDTIDWALSLALVHDLRRDHAHAAAYADTARAVLERRLQGEPGDRLLLGSLALAYALEGRSQDSRRTSESRVLQNPIDDLAFLRVDLWSTSRACLARGDTTAAVEVLEKLVAAPSGMTKAWLKVDPTFAPLRGNSRFVRLVTGS